MAVNLKEILRMVDKILDLEKRIEIQIKKESNARKRKKIRDAVKDHDSAALRDLWFK